jgi:hypothetical protein
VTSLTVRLPWPHTALWPNRNLGAPWQYRQKPKAEAKAAGYYEGLQLGVKLTPKVAVPVTYTFHPSTNRKYDLSGAFGACKAYEDGLAKALGLDDYYFYPVTLRRGEPRKPGEVLITIGVADA